MTAPVDPRAKARFLEALDLAPDARARFVGALARESPHLAAQVRSLLAAHSDGLASDLERAPAALAASLSAPKHSPGERFGDYELLEQVATGPFGEVWRARQASLDRIVALKLRRSGRASAPEERDRLRREAEAAARLDHPHITPVYEVGESEGISYFSMKWIDGGTLADRAGKPWPARLAVRLMVDVARAVHHAHQRGLLHRDLKPSNVLMDNADRPHVADFGIAERLDADARAASVQGIAGTPGYMAPEQADAGELTVATDVWGLGCILFELLTGRRAFSGDSVPDVLRRVRSADAPAPRSLRPEIARDLEAIVLTCLQRDPARRYPSASALADDLARWLAHEPIQARRSGPAARLALFARRSPLAATLVAIVSALVILLAAVASWASLELGSRLRESYLRQARATRLSRVPGARDAALELLRRAAAIRGGDDLRDEAIACLATSDLVLERSLARVGGRDGRAWVEGSFEHVAQCDERGFSVLGAGAAAEPTILAPSADVGFARWSSSGRWLLSKHDRAPEEPTDARLRVWDARAGGVCFALADAVSGRAADFSADERRLAYATESGELAIVGVPGGEIVLRTEIGARASSLGFHPDGSEILITLVGQRDALELRDAGTGALRREIALEAAPFSACWLDGGRRLAVACGDARIYLFESQGSEPCLRLDGHAAEVVDVFAPPRGPFLASYAWDETTRVWDLSSGTELRRFSGRVLGFDRSGERMSLVDERAWSVWRMRHGDFIATARAHRGKSPVAVAFAHDGELVASAGPDGVCVWSGRFDASPFSLAAMEARAVALLPGGDALAVGGPGGVWRVGLDGAREPELLLADPAWSLALSGDGRTLVAQGRAALHVLDPADPGAARTIPGPPGMEYVSISADGARIAVGNWRGSGARVWDLGRGGEPRVLLAGQVNVAAAISPDGSLLATTTSERFELLRIDTGESLLSIARRRAFGQSPAPVAFSPRGDAVAFGLSSDVVRLIDTRTLRARGDLEAPQPAAFTDFAFAPDGTRLAAGCATNRVQVWYLSELERELSRLGLVAAR